MKRNQIIAIALIAILLVVGISVIAGNLAKKDNGHALVFANGNKDC